MYIHCLKKKKKGNWKLGESNTRAQNDFEAKNECLGLL